MIGYSRSFNELYGPKPIEGKFKMNERIQELKKQCYRVEDPEGLFPREVFDEEKFAELIVKETLQVARAGIEYGDGMEDAVYKYFGVEE